MSAIVRPHITYEDLCKMPDDGNRYEICDGEAYMSPSPNVRHQEISRRIQRLFEQAISDRSKILQAPLDVVFSYDCQAQPDLILVLEPSLSIVKDVIRGTPDLLVEILSHSTAYRDIGIKMEMYARFGVGEYWIVDAKRTFSIHRLDSEARAFRLVRTAIAGDRVVTPLVPALDFDPSGVFAE